MNILTIDVGTHSVKFLETRLERKSLVLKKTKRIFISKVQKELNDKATIVDIITFIIHNYLKNKHFDGKIIFQIPNEFITTRYLNLPVTNRKKVEMMIPFQLDENLPFSISDAHYTTKLSKKLKTTLATINIARLQTFETFHTTLSNHKIIPAILTSELSVYENFIDLNKLDGPLCILDIGHSTTKAYFIYEKHIVSNHISHIAGKKITDVISRTYNIALDEATVYKHKNCFFLTSDQYENVDEGQRDFAKLMEQTIDPLVQELRRWELGFRVKYGSSINQFYITGGTSNINNIANYLTEALSIKVSPLKIFGRSKQRELHSAQNDRFIYSLTNLMAATQLSNTTMPNFLKGAFASNYINSISLHSTMFCASRVLMITVLILLSLLINKVVINSKNRTLRKKISKIIKKPGLNISKKDQRRYRKNPEKMLKILKKKNLVIKKEIALVKKMSTVDSLTPLSRLSQTLTKYQNVQLQVYKNKSGNIYTKFYSENSDQLDQMHRYLKSLELKGASLKKRETFLTLQYEAI
ncbi:MAG: pilus assembly protein PilM [Bacteriovoracaceae bacterium]|nr:pilus assembly protein PilM [Bacteriovoracaceae bacterium]